MNEDKLFNNIVAKAVLLGTMDRECYWLPIKSLALQRKIQGILNRFLVVDDEETREILFRALKNAREQLVTIQMNAVENPSVLALENNLITHLTIVNPFKILPNNDVNSYGYFCGAVRGQQVKGFSCEVDIRLNMDFKKKNQFQLKWEMTDIRVDLSGLLGRRHYVYKYGKMDQALYPYLYKRGGTIGLNCEMPLVLTLPSLIESGNIVSTFDRIKHYRYEPDKI